MSSRQPVHLPLFQRFDCHSCGYCCRNLVVNITRAEREKILAAGWLQRLPGRRLFERYRFGGRLHHRLAHRPDGGCVFLGSDGLCRLHGETGIETKPLACRLYPFVPSPGVDTVRLDLRADCPSVADNRGRSLAAHRELIAGLAEEVGAQRMKRPPRWRGQRAITARDFTAVAGTFEGLLRRSDLPIRHRFRAGCELLDLLYAVRLGKIHGDRFSELTSLLCDAAVEDAGRQSGASDPLPDRAGKLFRQWLFLHAVADDPHDLNVGLFRRQMRSWARYGQSRCFAAGRGPVPRMRPDWPEVDFQMVWGVGRGADEALEPLCRSMRVKLEAHAFAGPAYYGYDLLSGLTALWLMPALVGWFARLRAAGGGRPGLSAEDLLEGLRQTHHTFGVSPVFGRISERYRLRALARPGVPGALLAAYAP